MRDRGHVFVVHGNLLRLECDAWLLPCGVGGSTAGYWRIPPNADIYDAWEWPPGDWTKVLRCVALEGDHDRPRPFATHIGGGKDAEVAWFVEGALEFVARAHERLRRDGHPPRHGRARHLLAMPIVGTGYGGGAARAGEIVTMLLPELERESEARGIDIALVSLDASNHAAAQATRRAYWASRSPHEPAWPALTEAQRARAIALAQQAVEGKLVLFLGAGISRGAGLPDWATLLEQLAARAAIDDRAGFARLDHLDRAEVLERRFGGTAALGREVASLLGSERSSLAHALLAALPVNEIVTTNYDRLFEIASEPVIGADALAVLGPGRRSDRARWLLKMHGCVTRPEEIVLTRTDYLRYAEERGALMGIVQALLMTRHMLFVGFSLDDPNFHRIADAVRRAVRGSERRGSRDFLGTALTPARRGFVEELWSDDLDWIALAEQGDDFAEAARRHDVFLDCVAAHAPRAAHLFDPAFAPLLAPHEAELTSAVSELRGLVETVRARGETSPALAVIERMLVELGAVGRVPHRALRKR
ncbi:SIR2 family protein [Sandaracinus amylolyticus]|uniref:Uncharacterized protein n=1 Tax=Sandaracinus amylolyticus TaxID=927083 RepID=A0A0F6SHJ6_9BACT|nr:SIR2 family protein [Sandaracinus amylolyticus]AKF10559.1 hypothetical protein DB32_007708 [Sandaracinus amylolyticus]